MKKTGKNRNLKPIILSISLVFLLVLSVSLILAQAPSEQTANNFNVWTRTAGDTIYDAFDQAKINVDSLTAILLGFLLWMVIYSITKDMDIFSAIGERLGPALVSVAITILAFITIPEGSLAALALQFGITGTAILAIIPFLIMLYFTIRVSETLLMAKTIWAVFFLYYLFIFGYKIFVVNPPGEGFWTPESVFYVIIGGIALFMFFMIGTFRKWMNTAELQSEEEKGYQRLKKRALGRKLVEEETETMTS